MYGIAIEGERARNGHRYYLVKIDGRRHLTVFQPYPKKTIKFSTEKSAFDFMITLPNSKSGKEVVEIENKEIPHNKK